MDGGHIPTVPDENQDVACLRTARAGHGSLFSLGGWWNSLDGVLFIVALRLPQIEAGMNLLLRMLRRSPGNHARLLVS